MKSFVLALAALAASPAAADPADLKDFGLVCFCSSHVATPHRLVKSDNNGRVLLLARRGVTKAELAAAGERVTDSQLQALTDWGLLTQSGDRFTTAFPILGTADMTALRARLSPIAASLETANRAELTAVLAELKSRGQEQSAEAVLFAYILDGLTWRALQARHALPSQAIDVDHPYWNGTFWAVFPKQDEMPGTNSRDVGNSELRMMWTPPVLHWFDRLTEVPGGALTIDERTPDPIYVHGHRVAESIASALTAAKLDDVIPSVQPGKRVLIATHELIWMLMDRANRDLGITSPPVLERGAKSAAEVVPLIVVRIPGDKP